MQGVLPEEEAARLDGLGRLAIVWRIVLPMSGPGVAVTTIFTFVFSWVPLRALPH